MRSWEHRKCFQIEVFQQCTWRYQIIFFKWARLRKELECYLLKIKQVNLAANQSSLILIKCNLQPLGHMLLIILLVITVCNRLFYDFKRATTGVCAKYALSKDLRTEKWTGKNDILIKYLWNSERSVENSEISSYSHWNPRWVQSLRTMIWFNKCKISHYYYFITYY